MTETTDWYRKFSNAEYEVLIKDIIGATFYVNTSYRGKIAKLRQFAEVIVRKLLDIDPDEQVQIGNQSIQQRIKKLDNGEFALKSIKSINRNGSKYTHTQETNDVPKDAFDITVDSVLDLLSILLINYFEKYKFGSNNSVISAFSILPPIIRFKVLDYLNNKYPDNVVIIDKLVLATLKHSGAKDAIQWVESRKDMLSSTDTISAEAYGKMIEQYGIGTAQAIKGAGPSDMYQLCMEKISEVGSVIELKGALYTDFESALPYYRAHGVLAGEDPEETEFNDIMHFLYMGRKEKMLEICNDSNR